MLYGVVHVKATFPVNRQSPSRLLFALVSGLNALRKSQSGVDSMPVLAGKCSCMGLLCKTYSVRLRCRIFVVSV